MKGKHQTKELLDKGLHSKTSARRELENMKGASETSTPGHLQKNEQPYRVLQLQVKFSNATEDAESRLLSTYSKKILQAER